jgi:hypothetical protein
MNLKDFGRLLVHSFVLCIFILFLYIGSSISFADDNEPSSLPATWPLVQAEHITYIGAFRMPNTETPDHSQRLGYGGSALGYNPDRRSLFIGGHAWYNLLCEISIPDPLNSSVYEELPMADLLQGCADVTDGTLHSVKADARLGGSLVYHHQLITSAWSYYDADCSQTKTHGVSSSLDLSNGSNFSGFSPMSASARPRALAGYMTIIPVEWQPILGGVALTGLGGTPIISCASSGVAATVFNPDDVGLENPIPGNTLLYYPDPENGVSDEYFHWLQSTASRGIAFPKGTRSVLFIGQQGETRCYGTGEACNDPCDSSKGTHSYPYHIKVWAFDANDLVKVKNGEYQPWEIRPYAVWTLSELESGGCASIRSATYDPDERRLYIAPGYGEKPIIHVYEVTLGTEKKPLAPKNLRISSE